jgi:hypothetical protein
MITISAICVIFFLVQPVPGEEIPGIVSPPLILNYDISYGGYKIGEVDITQSQPFERDGRRLRELECRIESTAIIEHNGLYRSLIGEDFTALYLRADVQTSGNRRIDEYWFDYENRKISHRIELPGRNQKIDEQLDMKENENQIFDTISLIFRLRDGLDTLKAPFHIPVFVYSGQDSILIQSIAPDSAAGLDGYPVASKRLRGRIPFSTFPGFGDDFEIHISDDEDRIPLKADMEMALGKIEILLRPR